MATPTPPIQKPINSCSSTPFQQQFRDIEPDRPDFLLPCFVVEVEWAVGVVLAAELGEGFVGGV